MMDGTGMFGGGAGFGIVFMILFWALVIFGIIAIVRWLAGSSPTTGASSPQKSARQILDERYAHGEINREEYEQKKQDLAQ